MGTYRFFYFLLLFLLIGCGKEEEIDTAQKQNEIAKTFFSEDRINFQMHVYYELGAEPYDGSIGLSGNQTWSVTDESYKALFSQHSNKSILIPMDLTDMTQISNQSKSEWSYKELVTLGERISPNIKSQNTANITVIFLNGLFEGKSTTLGVHLSGHPFSFIFKDVVKGLGGSDISQKYIEQATVVHEMGHTVGLVDGGIPMQVAHEDQEHSHHTTNSEGVMYWSVESPNEILAFLTTIISTNQLNLFETESLNDARNFNP